MKLLHPFAGAVVLTGLALPGAAWATLQTTGSLTGLRVLWVASAAAAAGMAMFASIRARRWCPWWCNAVSALSLAVVAPLAVESCPGLGVRFAALPLVCLAVLLAGPMLAAARWAELLVAVLAAGAIAVDVTGLAFALGCVWALIAAGRQPAAPILLMAAASFAGLSMGTWLTERTSSLYLSGPTDLFAVVRDVKLLLPVLLIGGIGWTFCDRRAAGDRLRGLLAAWAGVSVVLLLAPLVSIWPAVRVLALSFWWLAPLGLAELARMLRSPRSSLPVRMAAAITVLVAAALALPAVSRWAAGLAVLAQSGAATEGPG